MPGYGAAPRQVQAAARAVRAIRQTDLSDSILSRHALRCRYQGRRPARPWRQGIGARQGLVRIRRLVHGVPSPGASGASLDRRRLRALVRAATAPSHLGSPSSCHRPRPCSGRTQGAGSSSDGDADLACRRDPPQQPLPALVPGRGFSSLHNADTTDRGRRFRQTARRAGPPEPAAPSAQAPEIGLGGRSRHALEHSAFRLKHIRNF